MPKTQEKIMQLVPSSELEVELMDPKKARFVKDTEHGGNKIYIFSGNDCPKLMIQVGILREMSFRNGGGGTGLAIDIDRWDEFAPDGLTATALYPYDRYLPYLQTLGPFIPQGFKQLIVWDPEEKEILGGYRYCEMEKFISKDRKSIDSPTAELFDCSLEFISAYAPFTIELGRSFVQPKYQLRADYVPPKKALYALDNLFDGLGTLVVDHKNDDIEYFFGKVTMYETYNRQARNMILYYMDKHFPDTHHLVTPKPGLIPKGLDEEIAFLESIFAGKSEREDKKILIKSLREIKQGMPPLFKKYTEMSPTMKVFGTAINHHCGDVEETCILTKFSDIVQEYQIKYILNYFKKRYPWRYFFRNVRNALAGLWKKLWK